MSSKSDHVLLAVLLGICIILLGSLGYGYWRYYLLSKDLVGTRNDLSSTTQAYLTDQQTIADQNNTNAELSENLQNEQLINSQFSNQINSITSTVGTLTKLSQTDPQLLEKYSKVYFLNENYVPASLATITPQFTYDKTRPLQFESDAYPFLVALLQDASSTGIDLQVASAYRSFSTQSTLKAEYKVTYGKGANSFSADQGYSEHQLGTAVDFTTSSLKGGLDGFEKTDAYTWLVANAYKYGFELSYPKGNTYYVYEPWHWRFVGKKLAQTLHDNNENFYDMDQRTIDTYLISLFDQ